MLEVLFSKYAIAFYFVVLNIEFLTKYAIDTSIARKKSVLQLADVAGFLSFTFLIFYSYSTSWWAFIGLLSVNFVLFVTIQTALKVKRNIVEVLKQWSLS
jgi:hypothetical protein